MPDMIEPSAFSNECSMLFKYVEHMIQESVEQGNFVE